MPADAPVINVMGRRVDIVFYSMPTLSRCDLSRFRRVLILNGHGGNIDPLRIALRRLDVEFPEAILTGNFRHTLPLYLRPEVFAGLKRNLDRLTLFAGPIDEAARVHHRQGFDGFNLSDIFEYMTPQTFAAVYGGILDAANPGARLVYWNMMAPRRVPTVHASRVRLMVEAEARGGAADKAFFYSDFVVEEVL